MKLYNIKRCTEEVTFFDALIKGLGKDQGLFFPVDLPRFSEFKIRELLKMSFIERSAYILSKYIGSELSQSDIFNVIKNAFNFSAPLVLLRKNIAILELFHGPTLAFKDFGSRFMAEMLVIQNQIKQSLFLYKKPTVILTATSGDTGAAVAHAFYGLKNIYVVILYPKNKVSLMQEKLFCTLGNNIITISVDGDFDRCQFLVKQAFDNDILRRELCLNSANSINISRLLAQICYYFEAIAQLPDHINTDKLVISVPSGNFGNLTAGLLAQSLGLPVRKFIAATNENNTVPRFLKYGVWNPLPTVETFSNAMDVSRPNNWIRIEELFRRENKSISSLGYGCVSNEITKQTVQEISDFGYIVDPHSAIAYRVLCDQLTSEEFGIFLGTAHPAKFKDLVECFLEKKSCILIPDILKKCIKLPVLSYNISGSFSELYKGLRKGDES